MSRKLTVSSTIPRHYISSPMQVLLQYSTKRGLQLWKTTNASIPQQVVFMFAHTSIGQATHWLCGRIDDGTVCQCLYWGASHDPSSPGRSPWPWVWVNCLPLLSVVEGDQMLKWEIGILKTDTFLADGQSDGIGLTQVVRERGKKSQPLVRY